MSSYAEKMLSIQSEMKNEVSKLVTLIPPNSRILRLGIFSYVSLEPRVFSTKSGFQTRYLLNNKNSELENSASLEPRVREGLV